jgi:hypothetical protein
LHIYQAEEEAVMLGKFLVAGFLAAAVGTVLVARNQGNTNRMTDKATALSALAAAFPQSGYGCCLDHNKIGKVEITEADPNSYSFDLSYREDASVDAGAPKADSEAVIAYMLKQLTDDGRHPSDESVNIFVFVDQPIQGITGKKLVHPFGYASYDYNNDSITYTACTGKGLFGC